MAETPTHNHLMPASPQTPDALPRLSIGHLLLLTLAVSVSLALIAPAIHRAWKLPDDRYRSSKLAATSVTIFDHVAMGLKIFGFAVLIRERFRSGPIQLSPG